LRNNYFDARNFFDNAGNPQAPLRQNQFGFELGGPVVLPKLYDGRNRTSSWFLIRDFATHSPMRVRDSRYPICNGMAIFLNSAQQYQELVLILLEYVSDPSGQIHDPTGAPYTNNLIPTGQRSSQAQAALQYMLWPIFLSQGRQRKLCWLRC